MKQFKFYFLALFILGCLNKVVSQNTEYQLLVADTADAYAYSFRIPNSNFDSINKISFYKKLSSSDSTFLLKEIYITKNGPYFLLVEGQQVSAIQNFFYTVLALPKEEVAILTNFVYKLDNVNGSSQSYLINRN